MMPVAAMADDYAAFARARAAAATGNVSVAAEQYGLALAAAPDNLVIAARAWREAIAAGDLPLARRAVATIVRGGGKVPVDAALLGVADAVKAGDAVALKRALDTLGQGPFEFLVPVVRAWTSLGKVPDPAAMLKDTKQSGAIGRVVSESRALLLIAEGRTNDGALALQGELAGSSNGLDLRYAAAELFAGQGQIELARKLVAGPNPSVAGFRDNMPSANGTPAFGVARAFARVAADIGNDERTAAIAATLLRTALLLDPSDERARVLLAGALTRIGAEDRALGVLDEIAPTGAFAVPAADVRVIVLRAKGDSAGALIVAKRLADLPGVDALALSSYADLLSDSARYADAAVTYATARDLLGDQAGWQIWLQIASAWESAGKWRDAKAAYDKSVALGPTEPIALNAYGYALIEHGEDMPRALTMLEQASRLAPNQPAIADSLAWAYFLRGDADKAIPLLESAALQSPGNAVISEHLGDVYWTAGRRYEARYAWRAAAIVAEAKDAPRLAAKIRDGLKPAS